MWWRSVCDDEAAGLAASPVAAVRLRIGFGERALAALRWVLGLAGAVVVLWFGGAFLAATPATAAVPVQSVSLQHSLSKSGSRSAGGDDDDSEEGSEKKSSEKKSSEKKSSEKKSSEKKSSEKKSSEKKSSEKKSSEKKSSEKKSSESESNEKDTDEKDTDEKPAAKESAEKASAQKSVKKSDEEGAAAETSARKKPAEKKKPTEKKSAEEDPDEDEDSDERRGQESDSEESADDVRADQGSGKGSAKTGSDERASEQAESGKDASDGVRSIGRRAADRVREAVQQHVDDARGERSRSERRSGERRAAVAEDVLDRIADALDEDHGDARDDDRDDARGEDGKRSIRTLEERLDSDAEGSADKAAWARVPDDAISATDAALIRDDDATRPSRSRKPSPRDPRGPPKTSPSLDDDSDGDDDSGAEDSDDDRDYDDSEEQTERVLEGRIELDESKARLAAERKRVAAGKVSAAKHKKHTEEHEELARRVEADRAELSPERGELVDEVVDGQRALSRQEKQLAAEEDRVGAGSAGERAHGRKVAAFEAQKKKVYEATDELMAATGHEVDDEHDREEGEGASAGCGSSGVFVECGAVSEGAGGNRDEDRCVAVSGVSSGCGVKTRSGDSEGSASCTVSGAGRGCRSSVSSKDSGGAATRASATCSGAAGDCRQRSAATSDGASAQCSSTRGECASSSSGRAGARPAGARSEDGRARGGSSARCGTGSGDCATSSTVEVGEHSGGEVRASAGATCEDGTGCNGSATATSGARAIADRAGTGSARCAVDGGGCRARSGTGVEQASDEDAPVGRTAPTSEGASVSSSAGASVDCDDSPACTGTATAATAGRITLTSAVRETRGMSGCAAAGGDCHARTSSEVHDSAASAGRTPIASSRTDAQLDCAAAGCRASASGTTSGAASGDVRGVRSSSGAASCTARGEGGSCSAASDTSVGPDAEEAAASGPVSVSHASASIECAGPEQCAGTVSSATSAKDTAVSPRARSSRSSADCTVVGGGCSGETSSTASSGGTRGPSSVARAGAALDCPRGCTGTAHSSAVGVDGAVRGGLPQGSTGSVSCRVDDGTCTARSVSVASAAPGAGAILAGQDQRVGAAPPRIGPSSVTDASASLDCADSCTGSATSSAFGSDGSRTRGSDGTVRCAVSGGACQGSSRSLASSGADVAELLPVPDATVQGDGNEPAAPPTPASGDGKAAVPVPAPTAGPSSFSDVFAVVDCPRGCTGGVSAGSNGSDAPGAAGALRGGAGSRGPPSASGSTTTGTCTAEDACRVQTQSSSGSGAGVNYLIDRNNAQNAEDQQLGTAPPPVPVTSSQSAVYATCGGPDCTVTTVGDAHTRGAGDAAASRSHTSGGCTGSTGCGVGSDSAASTAADTGMSATDPKTKKPRPIAGTSGSTQAGSSLDCPAGCDGSVSSESTSAARPAGGARSALDATTAGSRTRARSTDPVATGRATASTACTQERGACRAGVVTGAVAAATLNGTARFGTTSAFSSAACTSGGATTCPTRTSTTSVGTDDPALLGRAGVGTPRPAVKIIGSASCAIDGECSSSSGAYAADHIGQATAGCAGPSCRAGITGRATGRPQRVALKQTGTRGAKVKAARPLAGLHLAGAGARCTTGTTGSCEVQGQVGGTAQGAQAGAGCSRTGTATCRYVYSARSTGADRSAGQTASATAACSRNGGVGSGWCATTAVAETASHQAFASAACAGSAGTNCRYSYLARSAAGAKSANSEATALGLARGSGRFGGGGAVTSAFGLATPGQAVAAAGAACIGSGECRRTHSAHARASDAHGSNNATGSATGRGSGRGGTGGVMVAAQALAGPGYALAGSSCTGSKDCRHSYSARSAASARHGANWAHAAARGSGGGGQGAGGVITTAIAQTGEGYAVAAASCSGSRNCRHSYAAHSEDYAASHGSWARASADGSGGGGEGGGSVVTTAVAVAGEGFAAAFASCSGAKNCSTSKSRHVQPIVVVRWVVRTEGTPIGKTARGPRDNGKNGPQVSTNTCRMKNGARECTEYVNRRKQQPVVQGRSEVRDLKFDRRTGNAQQRKEIDYLAPKADGTTTTRRVVTGSTVTYVSARSNVQDVRFDDAKTQVINKTAPQLAKKGTKLPAALDVLDKVVCDPHGGAWNCTRSGPAGTKIGESEIYTGAGVRSLAASCAAGQSGACGRIDAMATGGETMRFKDGTKVVSLHAVLAKQDLTVTPPKNGEMCSRYAGPENHCQGYKNGKPFGDPRKLFEFKFDPAAKRFLTCQKECIWNQTGSTLPRSLPRLYTDLEKKRIGSACAGTGNANSNACITQRAIKFGSAWDSRFEEREIHELASPLHPPTVMTIIRNPDGSREQHVAYEPTTGRRLGEYLDGGSTYVASDGTIGYRAGADRREIISGDDISRLTFVDYYTDGKQPKRITYTVTDDGTGIRHYSQTPWGQKSLGWKEEAPSDVPVGEVAWRSDTYRLGHVIGTDTGTAWQARTRGDAVEGWLELDGKWYRSRIRPPAADSDRDPATVVVELPGNDQRILGELTSAVASELDFGRAGMLDGVRYQQFTPRNQRWYERIGANWKQLGGDFRQIYSDGELHIGKAGQVKDDGIGLVLDTVTLGGTKSFEYGRLCRTSQQNCGKYARDMLLGLVSVIPVGRVFGVAARATRLGTVAGEMGARIGGTRIAAGIGSRISAGATGIAATRLGSWGTAGARRLGPGARAAALHLGQALRTANTPPPARAFFYGHTADNALDEARRIGACVGGRGGCGKAATGAALLTFDLVAGRGLTNTYENAPACVGRTHEKCGWLALDATAIPVVTAARSLARPSASRPFVNESPAHVTTVREWFGVDKVRTGWKPLPGQAVLRFDGSLGWSDEAWVSLTWRRTHGRGDVELTAAPPDEKEHTRRLGQIHESRVTTADDLITKVDGQPLEHYVRAIGAERARQLQSMVDSGELKPNALGKAYAVVVDRRTGEVFEAINGRKGSRIENGRVHWVTQKRYESIREGGPYLQYDLVTGKVVLAGGEPKSVEYLVGDHPLRHAETKGMNEALLHRDEHGYPATESALDELVVEPWFTGQSKKMPRPAETCFNCTVMVGGTCCTTPHRYHPDHTPSQPVRDPTARGRNELIAELKAGNVRFDEEKLVDIGRTRSGQVVFLEHGNSRAGLQHIVETRADDFASVGVPRHQIAGYVFKAVTQGKVVRSLGGKRLDRAEYEFDWQGSTHRVTVTIGRKGYIVDASPPRGRGNRGDGRAGPGGSPKPFGPSRPDPLRNGPADTASAGGGRTGTPSGTAGAAVGPADGVVLIRIDRYASWSGADLPPRVRDRYRSSGLDPPAPKPTVHFSQHPAAADELAAIREDLGRIRRAGLQGRPRPTEFEAATRSKIDELRDQRQWLLDDELRRQLDAADRLLDGAYLDGVVKRASGPGASRESRPVPEAPQRRTSRLKRIITSLGTRLIVSAAVGIRLLAPHHIGSLDGYRPVFAIVEKAPDSRSIAAKERAAEKSTGPTEVRAQGATAGDGLDLPHLRTTGIRRPQRGETPTYAEAVPRFGRKRGTRTQPDTGAASRTQVSLDEAARLRTESRRVERESAGVRRRAAIPPGPREPGRRQSVSWQREAERADARIAELRAAEAAAVDQALDELQQLRRNAPVAGSVVHGSTDIGTTGQGPAQAAALPREAAHLLDGLRRVAEVPSRRGGPTVPARLIRELDDAAGDGRLTAADAAELERIGGMSDTEGRSALGGVLDRIGTTWRPADRRALHAGLRLTAAERPTPTPGRGVDADVRAPAPGQAGEQRVRTSDQGRQRGSEHRIDRSPRGEHPGDLGSASVLTMAGISAALTLLGGGWFVLGATGAAVLAVLGLGVAVVATALHRAGVLPRIRAPPPVVRALAVLSRIDVRGMTETATRRVVGAVGTMIVLVGSVLGVVVVLAAEPAAATAPANPPVRPTELIAARGDTLIRIARALGVTPEALAAANQHIWPTRATWDQLAAGQRLRIPPSWDGMWRVQRGDSLSRVAAVFGLRGWTVLWEANTDRIRSGDPDSLRPGEWLAVPGTSGTPTTRPTTSPTTTPTTPQSTTPSTEQTPPPTTPTTEQTSLPTSGTPSGIGRTFGIVLVVAGAVAVLVAGVLGIRALWGRAPGRAVRAAVRSALPQVPGLLRKLRHGAAVLVRWDVPMHSERARRAVTLVATGGAGLGAGLAVSASGPAQVVAGLVALAVAVVAWARARWSPVQPRSPPPGSRIARALRTIAAGLVGAATGAQLDALVGLGTAALARFVAVLARLPEALAWTEFQLGTRSDVGITILWFVATAVVGVPIAIRAVLQRARAARTVLDRQTHPRVVAAVGGLGTLVVNTANRVFALLSPAWGWVLSAATGSLVSLVQKKTVGATRTWTSLVAAPTALATYLALGPLGITSRPDGPGDYVVTLLAYVAVVAPTTFVSDYGVYAIGMLLRKAADRFHRVLDRSAFLRRTAHRSVTIFKPDYRTTLLKTLDPVLIALLSYLIVMPVPGMTEDVPAQALRIAVAALLVVAQWRFRDAWEQKLGLHGTLTDRTLYSRQRPLVRHQVQHSITRLRAGLKRFVEMTKRAVPDPWNGLTPEQAAEIAELLVEHALVDPGQHPDLQELVERVEKEFPGMNAALDRLRAAADRDREQERRIVALVIALMAVDRDAVERVVAGLEGRRKRSAAATVRALAGMLEALRGPPILDRLFSADDRVAMDLPVETEELLLVLRGAWERTLITQLKERQKNRRELLRLHHELLDEVLVRLSDPTWSGDRHKVAKWVRAQRGKVYSRRGDPEQLRELDLPGLVAAKAGLGDRLRDLDSRLQTARSELRSGRGNTPAATIEATIAGLTTSIAAVDLLHGMVVLLDEIEIHKAQRERWRLLLAAASWKSSQRQIDPDSLLATLLLVARRSWRSSDGAVGRMTAADVEALLGDGADRQAQLELLVEIGALTGDAKAGYTASDELREAWRGAHPQLRDAVLTDPLHLPGPRDPRTPDTALLAPLLEPHAEDLAAGTAYQALLDVLGTGQRVLFRHHTPGLLDDLKRTWYRRQGRAYEREHSHVALEPGPAEKSMSRRERERHYAAELAERMRAVSRAVAAWAPANRRWHRAGAGPNAPPAGAELEEVIAAFDELAALVDEVTTQGYPKPGTRPMRIERLLERATKMLARRPGAADSKRSPLRSLFAVMGELWTALIALRRAPAGGEGRRLTVNRAAVALNRFAAVSKELEEQQLHLQWLPRKLQQQAEKLALRLRRLDRQLTSGVILPVPGTDAPRPLDGARPHVSTTTTPAGQSVHIISHPGSAHGTNEDAAWVVVDDATGTTFAAAGDGLSSGHHSEGASRTAVDVVLEELRLAIANGMPVEEALKAAFAAAAERVQKLAAPGKLHRAPATTLLVVVVEPDATGATVTVAHVGDTRAYLVMGSSFAELLTTDDVTSGSGQQDWLTAWLGASSPRTKPTVDSRHVRGPATVYLTTDGMHDGLKSGQAGEFGKIAGSNAHEDPAEGLRNLERHALNDALIDDFTIVAVPIPDPGSSGGGPARLSHGPVLDHERAIVEDVLAQAPVVEELPAGQADLTDLSELTGGLDKHEFAEYGAHGVRVVDELTERVHSAGGPDDIVAWAGPDGWIYVDSTAVAAMRRGALSAAQRRELFRHELTHVRQPGLSEEDVQRLAPLPDLAPLAAAVDRVVTVTDSRGRRDAGLLLWSDGTSAFVLVDRVRRSWHRLARADGDVRVEIRGRPAATGSVLTGPSRRAVAAQLAALTGSSRAAAGEAARRPGLAVVRIAGDQVPAPLPPLELPAVLTAFLRAAGLAAPAPPSDAEAERRWAAALSSAPRYANLQPYDLATEQREAAAASVVPARVGMTDVTELMATEQELIWVLREDGSLWVAPARGTTMFDRVVNINHPVLAEGDPVLAAGTAQVRWGSGVRLDGVTIDVRSGHYHHGNTEDRNQAALALGLGAFARHGIDFLVSPQ